MHTDDRSRGARARQLLPGVGLALAVSVTSLAGSGLVARSIGVVVSPLVVAMLVGAALGSLGGGGRTGARTLRPGLGVTARTILRAGVVLLGLELSLAHLGALGWRGLAVVAITVACTFSGTLLLGRLLAVPALTRLYVATGFAICGAVAIAAVRGAVADRPSVPGGAVGPGGDAADADVALGTALALVTVYGSLAIVVMPLAADALGLTDAQAGLWIGASVQEVAQVVAAAGVVSGAALAAATVAKLTRVVLLAPVVAMVSVVWSGRATDDRGSGGPRLVPGFVLGFLGAVALRSTGLLPEGVLEVAGSVRDVLLAAAMFALGTSVDLVRLVRTGRRALGLGAAAATLCAGVGLAATLALT
ncbi:putative sulfate exporter family transporter [Sanguibacter sp. 25GB23B1]|uniref:YeiH family protein n=1 Tax=unclassified Sanguibacter TaxID=2645534 RepID=UPI0032AE9B8A